MQALTLGSNGPRVIDHPPFERIGEARVRVSVAGVCATDLVIDCTGSPDGLALASHLVRPRGTVVLKTTVHDLGATSPNAWVIDEITVVGSRCGPFDPALRLLAAGLVDPSPLITADLALQRPPLTLIPSSLTALLGHGPASPLPSVLAGAPRSQRDTGPLYPVASRRSRERPSRAR